MDNKELFVINFPPACSDFYEVMIKKVYIMAYKLSKFCRSCAFADIRVDTLFLIKITKNI